MKASIPSFNLYKKLNSPVHFEFHRLEESYNVYDASHAHRHNYYEILFFEKSGGEHEIDFTSYPIRKNSAHFISPEQVHRLRRKKNVTGYVLSFTEEFFLNDFLQSGFIHKLPFFNAHDALPALSFTTAQWKEFSTFLQQLNTELKEASNDKFEIIAVLLTAFLMKCRRWYESTQNSDKPSTHSVLTERFKQLVEKSFSSKKLVADYAAMLNVTAGHLSETVRRDTGKSAGEYLSGRIVLEAKRQLYHSSLSVKEIASALNFEDPSHFSKFFRTKAGMTPEQFRNKTREMYH